MSERSGGMKEQAVREVSAGYWIEARAVSAEDVPPGYKRTEVGVIPEDWQAERLGLHASFRTGPFGSSLHQSDYKKNGTPVINPMHIVDGTLRPSSEMSVDNVICKRLSEFRFRPGEIVIGRRGEIGRCAVIKDIHTGWLCGTGSMIIRPIDVVPEYLQRVLSSRKAIESIENSSVGSTMINLNQGSLSSLVIPLPSNPEQHAIATALSDVDELIASLDRLIAKKHAIKQAAMQQLLTGQTRLPGFTGEWQTRRLEDVAEIVMGQSPSSFYYNIYGHGLPLIQGNADVHERKTIKRIFTSQITKRGLRGDVLMSVRAPVGEISRTAFDVCLGRGVCAIRFPNNFMYHFLIHLEPSWARYSSGSTFDSINSNDVGNMEITLPTCPNEQTAIATVLSDMDSEIEALEHRREKTRQIKQGMMQQLLTGRVRLVAPEEAAA